MAPKQCPGKEVETFAVAAAPSTAVERPIAFEFNLLRDF